MTVSINQGFYSQFTSIVRHLAQQGDARLRPHVYEDPSGGEKYHFERLGSTAATNKTTATGVDAQTGIRIATPFVDSPWTTRTALPSTWQWADTIEHSDQVQMIVDPQSAYAQNGAMAMRRSIDDLIITASTADAADKAGGTNSFPVGQQAGAGIGQAMDIPLITEVNQKFQENDVDPDEPKCFVIAPKEVNAMLNDATLTSADYLAVKALAANGMVPNFMGFTWILSNRLAVNTNVRSCLAFTRRGIGLTVNQDIFVRIAERADLSHLIQVYMEWTMGAVRVEDEHVVEVLTDAT